MHKNTHVAPDAMKFRIQTSHSIYTVILISSTVELELLTLPEHMSSNPVLVGFVLLDLKFYMYVL